MLSFFLALFVPFSCLPPLFTSLFSCNASALMLSLLHDLWTCTRRFLASTDRFIRWTRVESGKRKTVGRKNTWGTKIVELCRRFSREKKKSTLTRVSQLFRPILSSFPHSLMTRVSDHLIQMRLAIQWAWHGNRIVRHPKSEVPETRSQRRGRRGKDTESSERNAECRLQA